MRGAQRDLRLRLTADKEGVGVVLPAVCVAVHPHRALRRVDAVVEVAANHCNAAGCAVLRGRLVDKQHRMAAHTLHAAPEAGCIRQDGERGVGKTAAVGCTEARQQTVARGIGHDDLARVEAREIRRRRPADVVCLGRVRPLFGEVKRTPDAALSAQRIGNIVVLLQEAANLHSQHGLAVCQRNGNRHLPAEIGQVVARADQLLEHGGCTVVILVTRLDARRPGIAVVGRDQHTRAAGAVALVITVLRDIGRNLREIKLDSPVVML